MSRVRQKDSPGGVRDWRNPRCRRLDGEAIAGPQAQEVAVADARGGLDKLVADPVAKAKRVQHILPVGPAKNEGLAIFLLPLEPPASTQANANRTMVNFIRSGLCIGKGRLGCL